MTIDTNVKELIINELTQAEYNIALQSGLINDNELYMVTDSNYVEADELSTVATSGDYNDLTNKPTIPEAQVQSDWNAVSGMGVILNKPTIPEAQVQSDWNAVSGMGVILNKPTLATVATSGSYTDLSKKPVIPVVDQTYNALSNNAQSGVAIEGMMTTKFQVVDSLPQNPVSGVFYFIKE